MAGLLGSQLVGAGFVGYGAYLDIEIGGSSISGWAGGMIAVGAVIMVLALGLVLCGHKRTWFLRLVRAAPCTLNVLALTMGMIEPLCCTHTTLCCPDF